MLIRVPKGWEIAERDTAPEGAFLSRRRVLQSLGFLGAAGVLRESLRAATARNPEFTVDRPITQEWAVEGFNNFYEFDDSNKENVKNLVGKFVTRPWKFEASGLVNKPQTFDVDDLIKTMPLEERVYRHRCVEAWSMVIPWMGFPFSELIKKVDPKPEAKFVRFVSVKRPNEEPNIHGAPQYPWPYHEGLRMDEAMNPLTLLVTGVFGKPLPAQNGAAVRIVMPWKYGFKGAKSIERIEFVNKQPNTLWNDIGPSEYGFYSNVNPTRPHPRWSQAKERVIPSGERIPTLMYNGYEKWVAQMYNGKEY